MIVLLVLSQEPVISFFKTIQSPISAFFRSLPLMPQPSLHHGIIQFIRFQLQGYVFPGVEIFLVGGSCLV